MAQAPGRNTRNSGRGLPEGYSGLRSNLNSDPL